MQVHELRKSSGFQASGKRLGRGNGSGKGSYSGKGLKGQKARKSGGVPLWFEGGQTPLFMRIPKLRWFKQPAAFQENIQVVTLARLQKDTRISGEVTKASLQKTGCIKSATDAVKILATGTLQKKLTFVGIEYFSASARAAIEQAGGSC